jgi:2-methylcitrate dehydratase PrpD
MAAFANGALCHALNYDAVGPEGGHLGVSAVAAPLAAAEKLGGLSGKELLAALAAGAELTARLAIAAARANDSNTPPRRWRGNRWATSAPPPMRGGCCGCPRSRCTALSGWP